MINKTISVISKILIAIGIIAIIGMAVFIGYFIVTLKSCKKTEGKHTEDFYYVIREEENQDGSRYEYVQLNEFTEIGKKKEVIVIPVEVEGVPVRKIGWGGAFGVGSKLKNDVVNKIFLPKNSFINIQWNLENLEKIIHYNYNLEKFDITGGRFVKHFTSSYEYRFEIYGGSNEFFEKDNTTTYFANVSFMANYETDFWNGYYWIDDYDYGSKIEFVPENPQRDGYVFGGWYKESECINKWDFETDTLPEEVVVNDVVQYQETRLYAKWD